MNRHDGVEQVGQVDAVGLGGEFEIGGIGIEGPRTALSGLLEGGFIGPEEHAFAQFAGWIAVIDGDCGVANGFDGDDFDGGVRNHAAKLGTRVDFCQEKHFGA